MKLRNLFMAVVAGAAMLVGCNKEVDLGPAKLALDKTTLAFEAAGGSQNLSVTATRDWAVSGVPEWVALSATSGKAAVEAQPVKITVAQNAEYNRSATIVFTIGFARTSLTIEQAGPGGEIDNGDGTLDNPYNVAGVLEYLDELGSDVVSPKKVFVAGIVSAVDEAYTTQYGNGSFKISDDGSTTGAQFTAYRVLYLGNKKFTASDTQVEVGDEVIIYGNVVNYKGNTPETNQNSAFLYSLNGVDKGGAEGGGESADPKGTGTLEDPFNATAANAAIKAGATTAGQTYYIAGKVASIKEEFGTSFGNGSFYINDSGKAADESFYCYRVLFLENKKWTNGNTQIKVGDDVIIAGQLILYNSTPETDANKAYVYSLNGKTKDEGGSPSTPSEPKGTGTVDDPYNPAGANAFISTLAADAESENDIYVKGIISSIKYQYAADEYGNGTFYITEDGKAESESFYCYRVLYLNNQKFTAGDTPVKVGDEVVVCGKVVNYQGNTPETASNKAYLYSLVPGEGGDPVEPGEDIEGYTIKLTNENTWTAGSDATYGDGFETVVEGIKIGVYKYNSTYAIVTPDQNAARVYKGAVISITAPEGLSMTALQFQASNLNSGQYCKDLTVLEGGSGTIPANLTTYKVGPWTGSAKKVVFHTPDAQSRLASVTIAFDGEFNPGGGDQPGGGDEPSTFETDLSKVIALADASTTAFEAIVAGVTSNSFVVTDGTNNLYVFKPATMAVIGDKVQVSGTKKTYGGVPEIDTGATVTVVSSDNTVSYGTVKDITESFDSYPSSATTSEYISFTGTLAKSGNYYNVTVEGATTNVGSISNPVSSLDLASLDGQKVKFTGFYVGFSSSKYVNMACIAAEAVGGDQPGGGDEPGGGDGLTLETAFTASEAHAWIMANIEGNNNTGETKYYVKGKVQKINYNYATANNNRAVFFITDDGKTSDASFEAYQVEYLEGKKWVEGNAEVAVGDEVVLYGPLAKYNTTAETQGGGKAYLYSLNGVTTASSGGDEPGGGEQPGGGDEPGGVVFDIAAIASANGWTNGTKYTEITIEDVVLTATGGSNTGKYYTNGNDWRFYQSENATLTITAPSGKSLVSVEFTYNVSNTAVLLDANNNQIASGSKVNLSGSTAVFGLGNTGAATNGQVKFTKIVVSVE